MGIRNLPSMGNCEIILKGNNVFVASGARLIQENPLSKWKHVIVEKTPYKRKVQFLRKDEKALMRLEDDEGLHLHCDDFEENRRIKIPDPPITFSDFCRAPLESTKFVSGFQI